MRVALCSVALCMSLSHSAWRLYGTHVAVCVSAAVFCCVGSAVWVYCLLSVHSSVDGYLLCFHFGGIKNSTAEDIQVQVFVWICLHFTSVRYLGVKLLGHMVTNA